MFKGQKIEQNYQINNNMIQTEKVILSCLQNILPIPNLAAKIGQHHNCRFILTNKFAQTLKLHKDLIAELESFDNIEVIPNYMSALQTIRNKKNPVLLVGDPHHQLHQEIKDFKVVTLEQICAIFPEKVPLSYRTKCPPEIKEKAQMRLGSSLKKEPPIKNILVTSHDIKMWDEAIQVILDLQPATIIVEYQKNSQDSKLQDLSMEDFIDALQTCHQVIYGTPLPRLEDFNRDSKHVRWILASRSLDQAQNVFIDEQLICEKGELVGIKGRVGKLVEEQFM